MKKIILYSLSLMAFCGSVKAQYLPASIPETTSSAPIATTLNARNTNCHSLNATQGSNSYELFAYSWDSYDQNTGGNGISFGWRTAGSSAPITMSYVPGSMYGMGNMKASDIAIVQTPSGNVYLVVTYYDGTTVNGPLKVRVFKWNIMGGSLTAGSALTIDNATNVTGTNPDVPTLHIDAVDYNHIGLSWTNLNLLKIQIGQVTDAITFVPYGTPHAVYGIKFDENRNDVAISNVGGNYKVTYVGVHGALTSVYSNDFSFIQGLAANAQLVPDVTGWPSLSYTTTGIPRIDCPDYTSDYKWSMITGHDQFYVGAMRLDNGVVNTIDLTSGMGVLVPQLLNYGGDIWVNTAVAYEPDNANVHFAWMADASNYLNPPLRYNGVKLDPTNTPPPSSDWDLVETNPQSGAVFNVPPCIALSGGNHFTGGLFMSFTNYYISGGSNTLMKYKTVPWGTTGYRPTAPTGISGAVSGNATFAVSPNPFNKAIQLNAANFDVNAKLNAGLYNIEGRCISNLNGSLNELNQQLSNVGSNLPSGTYLLKISGNNVNQSLKIIKE